MDRNKVQARLAKAQELRESQQKQLTEVKESIRVERSARTQSVKTKLSLKVAWLTGDKESRSNSLARLADLRRQVVTLEKELSAYGDCDPVKIEEKKRAVFLAKEAALRWTGVFVVHHKGRIILILHSAIDNYGTLLSYFVRQNGVDPAEIRRFLEIDEEYEDIS
ncbi:hypothetical protein C0989_005932 [Termitomyces sp. Mn162]|nr:hypothetical protein C0989_005932 [Termitomyces sp. Mn162]